MTASGFVMNVDKMKMSFVLNAFLRRVMWHIGIYINIPGDLDLIAIIVAFAMMTLMF